MSQIKRILMQRDGLTGEEADEVISEAKADLKQRLEEGEMPFDICEEHFGLEPDYLGELIECFPLFLNGPAQRSPSSLSL